jgi:predicted nucleotidyltransferase
MDNEQFISILKNHLVKRYGDIIDSVVLFGSRVQGASKEYSDYDVLIILKTEYDWHMEHSIYETCYELDLAYDILIDAKIISRDELGTIRGKQPYIQNALETGISA